MISMKYLMLELLLIAIRWYPLSVFLSLIQSHIVTAYYFRTAIPPKIITWYNSKTIDNVQLLLTDTSEAVTFTAIVRKTINCLGWFLDDIKQSNNYDDLSTFSTPCGTFRTEFWSINAVNFHGRTCKGTHNIDYI
ncbi:MAG: hypothetical protein M5U10_05095 [Candidatus Methanoperedens sp.]|nr:hypothetical protein [Candidatus Methanoperedens nitroreducens]MDJ1421276.1 hypothetical protein [Candidatus Methanoperedens sp.]